MPPWSTAKAEELLARLRAMEKAPQSPASSMTNPCQSYAIEMDGDVHAYG
jgi:hypothetical protein